jgi:hypothetical protein
MDEMAMAPRPRALDEAIPVSCHNGDVHDAVIVAGLVEKVWAR